MRGDFSRVSFDPGRKYDGVNLQMGRVLLDAEYNEGTDIQNHLREQALRDVIGGCCVPKDAPDSFSVTVSDDNARTLQVAGGRIYIDGLLYEQDEAVSLTSSVTEGDGQYVVYLEVFRRLVTSIEDPTLKESAVGVETAARTQVVCRLRLARLEEDERTCQDLAGWAPPNFETTGQLAAFTEEEPEVDPCLPPPGSGYRGLENHLYRVEVHASGEAGRGASFVWSRDNGSFASEWLQRDGNTLTVQSLGPDKIRNFANVQWVELLGDEDELSGEPGVLVRISASETDADGHGVLTVEVPDGTPLPDLASLTHPKVRAWDQTNGVDPTTGAIEIVADEDIPLESGIHVRFSPSGFYRAGDYWLIPARTFGPGTPGHIEWPQNSEGEPLAEAPAGVERHFCRLAVVDFDGRFSVLDDCRRTFPSLCGLQHGTGCCTIIVRPGESIQAAIGALPRRGGCICLKTGDHVIERPLIIANKRTVELQGEPGARIVSHGLGEAVRGLGISPEVAAMQAGAGTAIVVNGIDFALTRQPERAVGIALSFHACHRVVLSNCRLVATTQASSLAGLVATDCGSILVENCELAGFRGGLVLRNVQTVRIEGNHIVEGISATIGRDFSFGIHIDVDGDLNHCHWTIPKNHIAGFMTAVQGRGTFTEGIVCVEANQILPRPPLLSERPEETEKVFAIELHIERSICRENVITLPAPHSAGVWSSGSGSLIEGNQLVAPLTPSSQRDFVPLGILVALEERGKQVSLRGVSVLRNHFDGFQDAIVLEGGAEVVIRENQIGGPPKGTPRFGITVLRSRHTVISNNTIEGAHRAIFVGGFTFGSGGGNEIVDNIIQDGILGVHVHNEVDATVRGNTIQRQASLGILGMFLAGNILISQNRVSSCARQEPEFEGVAVAIGFAGVLGELRILDCVVLDTGSTGPEQTYGIFAWAVLDCRITGNLVSYSTPAGLARFQEGNAIYVLGWDQQQVSIIDQKNPPEFTAMLTQNKCFGPGFPNQILVDQKALEETGGIAGHAIVYFNENHCSHERGGMLDNDEQATVSLKGLTRNIVTGNRVQSAPGMPGFHLNGMAGWFFGNSVLNALVAAGNMKPVPLSSFNDPE
jgi:nitrous oxidase accessory protein NosD